MGFSLYFLDRMEVIRQPPETWHSPGVVFPETFDPIFEACQPHVHIDNFSVSDYLFRTASILLRSAPPVEHPRIAPVMNSAAAFVDKYFPSVGTGALKVRTMVREKRVSAEGDAVVLTPAEEQKAWIPWSRRRVYAHFPTADGMKPFLVWVTVTPDPTDPQKAIIHPRALETLRNPKRKEEKATDETATDEMATDQKTAGGLFKGGDLIEIDKLEVAEATMNEKLGGEDVESVPAMREVKDLL
jgi:hypothetical protein